jgi:hypothetical protein
MLALDKMVVSRIWLRGLAVQAVSRSGLLRGAPLTDTRTVEMASFWSQAEKRVFGGYLFSRPSPEAAPCCLQLAVYGFLLFVWLGMLVNQAVYVIESTRCSSFGLLTEHWNATTVVAAMRYPRSSTQLMHL